MVTALRTSIQHPHALPLIVFKLAGRRDLAEMMMGQERANQETGHPLRERVKSHGTPPAKWCNMSLSILGGCL